MKIGGLQKLTLVDYLGKIAATVFTVGCNFACPFCHNPNLADGKQAKSHPLIPEEEVFSFLDNRRDNLDGVCITGGEPTLFPDLADFIRKIKNLGFAVKLDTNGTNPEAVEALIAENLVDYIAMDIKASLSRYTEACGRNINLEKIKKSVKIIQSFPEYEFRTTTLPRLHTREDFMEIGEWLSGSQKYYIQQFRADRNTLNPDFAKERSYSLEELNEFCEMLKPYFGACGVRG